VEKARLIWDKNDPDFQCTVKKELFWATMDDKYYPAKPGASRLFYQRSRSDITKAISLLTETAIPEELFQAPLKEWDFLIPTIIPTNI